MAVIVEKVLVVVTFLLCLFLNALAARGDLSGTTIGEVSNKYPTYVTPDNITFAVWGVTYLLQLLLVVAQIATTESTEKLLSQPCCMTTLSVRWRLVMIFLLNALWLPLYANLLFGKSMLVICVYLALLISVYLDVNTRTTQSFWEWVMYGSGIACNVSWVLVAAVANKLTLAASMGGWADANGVAGSAWFAGLVVAILSGVAIMMASVGSDFAWSLVTVWYTAGMYRQHTYSDPYALPPAAMNKTLAMVCLWASMVVSFATLCGFFLIPSNGAFGAKKNDVAAE
ncbi:unnamed protein product [Symbiodinium natans]|uniref:Uncharacterized protein n=1 Tax=Symbiodinium natans TaxID=878477 RepID=A0A812R8G9_9DINO|nr:unnamed protein product [Symbiodinium natans]